jgi:hypothetical protein
LDNVEDANLASIGILLSAYDPAFAGPISSTVIAIIEAPMTNGQTVTLPISGSITRDATLGGLIGITIGQDTFAPGVFPVSYSVISGYITLEEAGSTFTLGMQNPNYSFFYESAVNSNGRPWVANPDGQQNYNMVLFRYGQAYQQDTNINNVNRFFASQLDEYARSKGDIRRLVFRQRILRVFQAAGVGQVGVYSQFITNANGVTQLIYTTQIITQNNIQYYLGENGMGAQKSGLISNRNADNFIDPVTGEEIRLSNDGMTSISKKYKGQYYIGNLFLPYNFTWDRPDGSTAKILGVYDHYDEQWVHVLQSGSRPTGSGALLIYFQGTVDGDYVMALTRSPHPGDIVTMTLSDGDNVVPFVFTVGDEDAEGVILGLIALVNSGDTFDAVYEEIDDNVGLRAYNEGGPTTGLTTIEYANQLTIDSYAFSFNEPRNAYCSFYDFNEAESLVAAENIIISFKNGQLYRHDSNTYCNFYGVQYAPSITLDFDGGNSAKKTFIALSYQANGIWAAPEITTQLDTYGNTPQSSKLVAANFKRLEGVWHSAFLRDLNSRGGWLNGASLKGGYLVIKLEAPNDGGYYYINVISLKSIPSPLNNQ